MTGSRSESDRQRSEYMRRQRQGSDQLHSSSRRTYEQFRASIRSGGILDERYVEPELMVAFGATRNSLRRSLQMLAQDGLLSRRRRAGTSLNGEIIEFPTVASSSDGVAMNCVRETRFDMSDVVVEELTQQIVVAPDVMKKRLSMEVERILIHEQLGRYEGVPLFLRVGYMPLVSPPAPGSSRMTRMADADGAPGGSTSLVPLSSIEETFEFLFGEPLGRGSAAMEAVPCEPVTAALLGIEPGWPMLLRELILCDSLGRPREYSFTHFRGDRVALTSNGGAYLDLIE